MSGIIVDIDGTLLSGNNGIQRTIDYINSQKDRYDIFIVTGRPESDRDKTVKALKENGVRYNRLFMNPHSGNTPDFKHETAQRLLLKQRIILAIDNDEKARNAYKSLGIRTLPPTKLSNQ
jgi:ribonucleotide monophosphatase NagD (HAD superfamily)